MYCIYMIVRKSIKGPAFLFRMYLHIDRLIHVHVENTEYLHIAAKAIPGPHLGLIPQSCL